MNNNAKSALDALAKQDDDELIDAVESILNESSECSISQNDRAKILSNLIEMDSELAAPWAAMCETESAEIVEPGEDSYSDEDGTKYVIVTRKLLVSGEIAAEWTICSMGFYVHDRSNPNYNIGWNVDENTDGGDGIGDGALRDVLDQFGLLDEATELPDVDEPEEAEQCAESEAEYCVMLRNTYTHGMEEYEPRSYHPSRKDAEKAMDSEYREFRSQNSDNSYGPEWAVGERDESGKWVPTEDE